MCVCMCVCWVHLPLVIQYTITFTLLSLWALISLYPHVHVHWHTCTCTIASSADCITNPFFLMNSFVYMHMYAASVCVCPTVSCSGLLSVYWTSETIIFLCAYKCSSMDIKLLTFTPSLPPFLPCSLPPSLPPSFLLLLPPSHSSSSSSRLVGLQQVSTQQTTQV